MPFNFALNPANGSFQAPSSAQPNYAQMLTNLRSGPGPQLGGGGNGGGMPTLGGLLTANPQALQQALTRPQTPTFQATPWRPVTPAAPGAGAAGGWDFLKTVNPSGISKAAIMGLGGLEGMPAMQPRLQEMHTTYQGQGGGLTPYDWYNQVFAPANPPQLSMG